MQMAR
jgi:hypothetical protein